MKLYEYEAKEIFARYGIKTPEGLVATDLQEVRTAYDRLGGKVVVKAQVHVGGRGKAGGIKLAESRAEVEKVADAILSMQIKELPVTKVLIEKALDIAQEYYFGVTIDRARKAVVGIASVEGGVDIEEVSRRTPEKIAKVLINPLIGIRPYHAQGLLSQAGFPKELTKSLQSMVQTLYQILMDLDASLVEINPLVIDKDGQIIAADAKIDLDDNALFRHQEMIKGFTLDVENPLEVEAAKRGLTYVKLDGEIGVIGNGAGLVMATLDAIKAAGGRAANFLDIGGGAKAEVVKSALELLAMDPQVKGILVNTFGGITRCDEVAKGILEALSSIDLKVPIVLRLKGTRADAGRKMIEAKGFTTENTLKEAAVRVVNAVEKEGQ